MFKKIKPSPREFKTISYFPHCDQRILHAPGDCEVCDKFVGFQELRFAWGIAFTGYEPEGKELPCPADYARGDSHKSWGGNIAKTTLEHIHIKGLNSDGRHIISVAGCPACDFERENRRT